MFQSGGLGKGGIFTAKNKQTEPVSNVMKK